MPRATRARAARGALKEKSAADANVPAVEGVMAAKAVDGIARGAADAEAAGTMFVLENELKSMDVEVERRCAQLHEAADTFAARIRKELRAQLTKIPKKTKGMTLRAFLDQHGEDVRASLAETLRERARRDDDARGPAETSAEKIRKRGRAATAAAAMLDASNSGLVGGGAGAAGAPPCTPADRGVGRAGAGALAVAQTPGTTRGPRRGEVLYSRNGSPLGAAEDGDESDDDDGAHGGHGVTRAPSSCVKRVMMTSSKKRRVGGDDDDAPGLVLTTDDGKEIDVAAVPADGAEVEETMGMLAKMQAQVAAHMARLMAGRR